VDKLLEKYLDRSIINNKAFEVTPIIYAVHKNNIYLIRKLIELGAKTAIKDNFGRTALHHASVQASKGEPNAFEIVKLLIEANPALPNIRNLNKKGPGNPVFATKKEVRNYIRTRKTGWFTKRKENTNAKKVGGTRRNR
jgi:ankyrin repeat protein